MINKKYSFIQETCEIVSELFNVVITTIDTDFIRTTGTGLYKAEIGSKVENSNVFKSVIEQNQKIVISSPGKEPACADCENKNNCKEKAAVYAPLHVNGEIRGAIGFIAFTDEQKNNGLFGRDLFVDFTEKLSELISSRIETVEYADQLMVNLNETLAILNSVHDGVIAVDNDSIIYRINESATRNFGITEKLIGSHISCVLPDQVIADIQKTPFYIDNEVTIRNEQGEVNVLLTAKRIEASGTKHGTILNIKSFTEASNIASNILHKSDYKVEFSDIVGESKAICEVIDFSHKIAGSDSTVLIRGESGTGKELFARAIHNHSSRKDGPFVAINCGAIPETLLESELFGYEDGAFTGAKKGGKIGKCQLANGGTLFLDEVGDIPIFLQVKFLRMLQERTIERVGGNKSISINVRVIAATNRNLETMMEDGEFRSDLYYRLNVIPIFIPPLRERSEDILVISRHFMEKYSRHLRKHVCDMTPQAAKILMDYHWPGNIRELENTIECALNVESQEILTSFSIPARIKSPKKNTDIYSAELIQAEAAVLAQTAPSAAAKLRDTRRKTEIDEVLKALDKYGWDTKGKKHAATSLGIGIATLYRILKDYQNR